MGGGDIRGEIALLGIDPDWRKLTTGILKSHGFASRAFDGKDDLGSWLRGEGADCRLVIADMDGDSVLSGDIRRIQLAFPGLRVLPVPSRVKPTELFRILETNLPRGAGSGKSVF